ncbi:MAG: hypothetical protein WC342_05470 [Methanoregula sp.]
MTEMKGHFEKGIWVEDPVTPPVPAKEENPIDMRFASATKSFVSAMNDIAQVTHDLVATEEGKKHIENTVKETTAKVQKSFDDILSRAKTAVDKAKAEIEKAAADPNKPAGQKK